MLVHQAIQKCPDILLKALSVNEFLAKQIAFVSIGDVCPHLSPKYLSVDLLHAYQMGVERISSTSLPCNRLEFIVSGAMLGFFLLKEKILWIQDREDLWDVSAFIFCLFQNVRHSLQDPKARLLKTVFFQIVQILSF